MNTQAQQYLDKLYISDMNKMLDFLQKKNEFRDKNKNLMGPWAGGAFLNNIIRRKMLRSKMFIFKLSSKDVKSKRNTKHDKQ